MRRLLAFAVLVLALALPVQAAAKTKRFSGNVTPSGTIAFRVVQKKHSKKKRITKFSFFGIPVTCQEGARTTRGLVDFGAKIWHGRFKFVASNSITGATLRIRGNLPAGTLRVSGNVPIDPSGQGTNCDSGLLGWRAHRR